MLGFSIYPDKAGLQENKRYIKLAHKNGFKMMFTCLLSINEPLEKIITLYKELIEYAAMFGIEVTLDVSPRVFKQLGIDYTDLSFFKHLGAQAIRLDESYNGRVESDMTYNSHDLKIVVNMSQDTPYIDNIMSYFPKTTHLVGCHNFYPGRDCGLSMEFFNNATKRFKQQNIRTGAFVSSTDANIGPWQITDGLCTLEMHRDRDIITQAKHLYALNTIDDIIIANKFASRQEMESLSNLDRFIIDFRIKCNLNLEIENKILFEEKHFYRGDVSDKLIRSTQSRVKYKLYDFQKHDCDNVIPRGSIVIGNNDFGQYKGELQIILHDIVDNELKRNIVGHIIEEELFLLDYLKPWQKFSFTKI